MELTLLVGLMTKHVIADYFMQYSWMIKHKGEYGHWKGMAHSEFHGFLTWIVLSICGVPIIWAALLGIIDTVVHYHVDYVKTNVWKNKGYTAQDQMYWVTHGVDQFAHFLTYVGLVILCV